MIFSKKMQNSAFGGIDAGVDPSAIVNVLVADPGCSQSLSRQMMARDTT